MIEGEMVFLLLLLLILVPVVGAAIVRAAVSLANKVLGAGGSSVSDGSAS